MYTLKKKKTKKSISQSPLNRILQVNQRITQSYTLLFYIQTLKNPLRKTDGGKVRKISKKFCSDRDCVWPMHVRFRGLDSPLLYGPQRFFLIPTGTLLQDLMCLYSTHDRKL